jgi:glycosyltransferase involved in cell wall biosynthesis
MKKQVLILMGSYLPGYKVGGPLISIHNMIGVLSSKFHFKVLTTDCDFGETNPYKGIETFKWIRRDNHEIFYLRKNLSLIYNAPRMVRDFANKDNIVYLNSFFNFPFAGLILILRGFGIISVPNIIIAPRGEFGLNILTIKSFKKALYIWFFNKLNLSKGVIWHASSEFEAEDIIRELKVCKQDVKIAINITQIQTNIPLDESQIIDREKNNESLRIVFLSRISKEKNLTYALEILKKLNTKIEFDIFGPIQDDNLWNKCENLIKSLPPNISVNYKGVVKKELVKNTFQLYDLFLFPTIGENYGHVIAESLSVGTPVLISNQTPWLNLEKEGLGWDLSLDNIDDFVNVINLLSNKSRSMLLNERRVRVEKAQLLLSNPILIENYISLFENRD